MSVLKPPSSKKRTVSRQVTIGMISLGCPKTLVDSEVILGKLDPAQYKIQVGVDQCDVALINTCSFIREAQQESVDRILELVELKKQGRIKSVMVMGCLVQEFPDALKKELKEVDAFIGSGEYQKIPSLVEKVTKGKKVFEVGTSGYLHSARERRVALTPKFSRYLKISEGCDHVCTFCTIPQFRGKHRSRPLSDVTEEARILVSEGAKELIVTGQDTSFYGRDFSGKFLLPELLESLNGLSGLEWIRLMYVYPSCITPEMMDAIAKLPKVCKYLDMPLQHASDPVLQRMKRGISRKRTEDLLREFRRRVPGLAIRTTFIVGFPGETRKDFDALLDFMREFKFERAGVFKYSREEGSPAAALPNQVAEPVKEERFHEAMRVQQEVSKQHQAKWIGKNRKVLIEGPAEDQPGFFVGRSEHDAPEIDGSVLVQSAKKLEAGTFYSVKITEAKEYDLVGRV